MMPVMRNQNWLPSLFNDFFGDEWMGMQHKHASVPAINIIENEKDFRVELAVPGTTKEDFKVNVNADNELVISLEKRSEKEEKEGDKDKKEGHRGTYLRREFSYTSFQQSFSLPDDVDRQKISAKVENGVLTIDLPKKEVTPTAPVSHQIEIKYRPSEIPRKEYLRKSPRPEKRVAVIFLSGR